MIPLRTQQYDPLISTSRMLRAFHTVLMIFVAGLLVGCSSQTERDLRVLSKMIDPATTTTLTVMDWSPAYVKRTSLPDLTEIGIVTCTDGGTAKYWFRSHHLAEDLGGTLFQFSDGRVMFQEGWSCCNLEIPATPFATLDELAAYVKKYDGVSP